MLYLQEYCLRSIIDRFFELGPFYEPELKASDPEVKCKDWTTLDNERIYEGQWNRFCEPEGFGVILSKIRRVELLGE